MASRDALVSHLRAGKPIRFDMPDDDFVQSHEMMDELERIVGLALERREVIDAVGSALIVWIRGFGSAPIETRYACVGPHTKEGFAA